MRERVEVLADEADDELVVAGVETVTCETDVGRQLRLAIGDAERGVLTEDVALIDRLELRERSLAPERVPHVPARRLVRDVLDGTLQEHPFEIGLVAGAVRATDHGVVVAELDVREGRLAEQRTHLVHEQRRILAPREEADAPRVHRVGVDDARDLPIAQRLQELGTDEIRRSPLVARHAEDEELHEEPAVHRLLHAFLLAAVFVDVDLRQALGLGRAGTVLAHGEICISPCPSPRGRRPTCRRRASTALRGPTRRRGTTGPARGTSGTRTATTARRSPPPSRRPERRPAPRARPTPRGDRTRLRAPPNTLRRSTPPRTARRRPYPRANAEHRGAPVPTSTRAAACAGASCRGGRCRAPA